MSRLRVSGALLLLLAVGVMVLGYSSRVRAGDDEHTGSTAVQIVVPDEDRFAPFAITVRVGQKVVWVNNDTDDHTIVSNDAFNTAGHHGANVLLKAGGRVAVTFHHPGVFPYYCRFHAVLDSHHQPKAPGPDGGIQDANGNFGTPMNGVITVLGRDQD